MTQKTRPLSHRIQKRTGPGRTNIMRLFRTRFWTQGFPFVMRSRKAGLPFATQAQKRELCLQRYVSRMNQTENFCPKFKKYFPETTCLCVSCYPDHYEPKIFFRFFSKYFFRIENFLSQNILIFFWKLF